jgi:hypothetical protein
LLMFNNGSSSTHNNNETIAAVSGVYPKIVPISVIQEGDEEDGGTTTIADNGGGGGGGGGGESLDEREETLESLEGSDVSHDVETKDGNKMEVIDFIEDIHGGDSRRRSLIMSRESSDNGGGGGGRRVSNTGRRLVTPKSYKEQREETEKFWKEVLTPHKDSVASSMSKSESSVTSEADADTTCEYLMSKALIAKVYIYI